MIDKQIKVLELNRSKPLSIRTGQPNDKPNELITCLNEYFKNEASIDKSVLGLVEFVDAPVLGLFSYVIGVYGSENDRVIPELKSIAYKTEMARWPVIFADMDYESGLFSGESNVIYQKSS